MGTKYFNNSVYIHDLYVTGTEFIANTTNNFIESPYLLLNLTGGAIDGGIFFVTGLSSGTSGTPLTGINDSGPIIGFDHTNKFKFGVSTRNSDLSLLNDIASVQDIIAYSGIADNKFATIINLNLTGSGLQTQIDALSSQVVYTTGNQTINGDKTFNDKLIAKTGFFGSNNLYSGNWTAIGGGENNIVSGNYSTVGGGYRNCATELGAIVGGGFRNCATGQYSTVGGGTYNRATAFFSTVGGGNRNCAAAGSSTVGGGDRNCATVVFSTVGGGRYNCAAAGSSTVGGGNFNEATGPSSTVGGGRFNRATAACSTVGGGYYNSATAFSSTVGGGERNCILSNANHSYIIGGRCSVVQANHSGAAVLGDGQNRAHLSFSPHSLTLDFATGIHLASSTTGTLASASIANYLRIFVNSNAYYLPMYTGTTFTAI